MNEITFDLSSFDVYADARREFLWTIGCNHSCRDPLSEFAERLVCHQLGGTLAGSRVEKDFDLTTQEGRRVQVKVLSNPKGKWRNEHPVRFTGGMDDYAVAFFEDIQLQAIIIFKKEGLDKLCSALGKRHPHTETQLLLTQANFKALMAKQDEFKIYGVQFITKSSST